MRSFRICLAATLVAGGAFWFSSTAHAGGRKYFGGHPYHSGFYQVPPASAWMPVRVRPPVFYGAPAYYYPSSYLGVGSSYVYAPRPVHYANIPNWRAGGYYMSARAYANAYPW